MKRFISTEGKEVSKSKKTDECLIFEPKGNGVTIMTKMLPTDQQLAKASDWLVDWGGGLDVSEDGGWVDIKTDPNTFAVTLDDNTITSKAQDQISGAWVQWVAQFADEKAANPAPTSAPAPKPEPKAPTTNPEPTTPPTPPEEDPDPGPTDSGKGSSSPFVAGEKPYWEEPQEKWGEIFDRQVDFYLKQYEESVS